MRSPGNLRAWLTQLLPHHSRCAREAHRQLLQALLLGFTANLCQLARQLPRSTAAKEKRPFLARWLGTSQIDPEQVYTALTVYTRRVLRAQLRERRPVVLLIDFTFLAKRWAVLQVSIRWQGRALPLYRSVSRWKDPEVGQTEQLEQACKWLKQHLPGKQARYILLLDRGFPSHGLIRFWQAQGWRFMVRADNRWKLTHPEYTGSLKAAGAAGRVTETPRGLPDVELGRKRKGLKSRIHWSVAHVVFFQGPECQEPWYLLTSETDPEQAVAPYRERMQIEGEFRDLKGPGGLEELAEWEDVDRIGRFLAWVAVYEWRLAYLWLAHRLSEWGQRWVVKGKLSWMSITRAWIWAQIHARAGKALACL